MDGQPKNQLLHAAIADLGWRAEAQRRAAQNARNFGAVSSAYFHDQTAAVYSARAFELAQMLTPAEHSTCSN